MRPFLWTRRVVCGARFGVLLLGWLQLAGLLAIVPVAQCAPVADKLWHAREAIGPIVLDGRLNEPAWQSAEMVTLTEQSPHPGEANPYLTEVKVLLYKDMLVFGFRCHDPEPHKIITHTYAIDGYTGGDDTVSVVLDSFGDKRTGYFFQVNAVGARVDGLIAGPGDVWFSWDGIWNGKTARTADGWSAEIEIPAQTLTFRRDGLVWGVELDRSVGRDQTELRWASPLLDADFFDMSRTGQLDLARPLRQGYGIELAPYARGTKLRDFTIPGSNWLAAAGGELTWRITPQLAAVGTVNTDFAETEVDTRQVNTTPFPLYYPEKRAFFLEGANLYDFGLGLGTTFVPYYSRNVGLLDGYNIPINGGVKVNGHVGRWSIGLTDVETRTTWVPTIVQQTLGLPSQEVKGTNLLASRFAYDVDKHLRLGTMLTHGDPESQLSNTLAGLDAVWHTPSFLGKHTLEVGGWGATTQGDVPVGKRQGWGYEVDYPNDLVNCSGSDNHFGDGFEPLMGFIPRPQTNQYSASCDYKPRPVTKGHFGAVRQADYGVSWNRITDNHGNLETQRLQFTPLAITFNSGDQIFATASLRHELLPTPFTIYPGVTYPAGQFDFQRYGAGFYSSPQRPLQLYVLSRLGGYYDGHMYYQYLGVNYSPLSGRVRLEGYVSTYDGHTREGNFTERLYQLKGTLAWSPDLSVASYWQFDNVSNSLSNNTRFRWTVTPGRDVYVVWDRTWLRDVSRPGLNLGPSAESLTLKLQWTFRM